MANSTFPLIDPHETKIGYLGIIPKEIREMILKYDTTNIIVDEFIEYIINTHIPRYGYELNLINIKNFEDNLRNNIHIKLGNPINLNEYTKIICKTSSKISNKYDRTNHRGDTVYEIIYYYDPPQNYPIHERDALEMLGLFAGQIAKFILPNFFKKEPSLLKQYSNEIKYNFFTFIIKILYGMNHPLISGLTENDFEEYEQSQEYNHY